MPRIQSLAIAFASLSMLAPTAADAQGFPRAPRVEQPRLPDLPDIRSIEPRTSSRPEANAIQEFMIDVQKLSDPIDTTTVTEADNDRIDRDVADYRALADRVAGGRHDAVPAAQREPMLFGLKTFYDGAAGTADDTIEFAKGLITGRGKADAAYNHLLVHDTYLYAAQRLFPSERAYSVARKKMASAIDGLGGSRGGARRAEDSAELAAARKVMMPPSVTNDKGAQALFRQAWKTSGIPWEIMKINVTSGWRDKVENGRVIGQRRDAAIAARDPNNRDRCNLYDFTMFRDRSGAVRRDSHSTTRIACENVR